MINTPQPQKLLRNKKGAIFVIGIIIIIMVIILTLIISKISFRNLVGNISGDFEKERDNFLVFGGHSNPFGEGVINTRDKCLALFRAKNIPSNAVCNSGSWITSNNVNGVCAVRFLAPEESGRFNAMGQRESEYVASYCCGKSFLPERCKEPLVGAMVIQ